jgi:hypothetical protein
MNREIIEEFCLYIKMTIFVVYTQSTCVITSSSQEANNKISENSDFKVIAFCSFEEAYSFIHRNKISSPIQLTNANDVLTIDIQTKNECDSFQWIASVENSLNQCDVIQGDILTENEPQSIISAIQHCIESYQYKDLRFKIGNKDIVKLFKKFRYNKKISLPEYVYLLFQKLVDINAYLVTR